MLDRRKSAMCTVSFITTSHGIALAEVEESAAASTNSKSLCFEMMEVRKSLPMASLSLSMVHQQGRRPTQVPLFLLAKAEVVEDSRDYRLVKIKGDGRCMFRALVNGMTRNKGKYIGGDAEAQQADALRLAVAEALCRSEVHRLEFEEAVEAISYEADLPQYCERIQSPQFWGGEAELLVLSKLLQQPIFVYLKESGGYRSIQEYGKIYAPAKGKKGRQPIRLLYQNNNHYDLLVRK